MLRPHLIMHRRGTFRPGKITDNQCSKCGQQEYHYKLTMAFDNNVQLDERNFIFDSLNLTSCINSMTPIGSCEEMHYAISECIIEFFKKRQLPILTYKFMITSGDSEDPRKPWFEHVFLNADLTRSEKVMALTPLLL